MKVEIKLKAKPLTFDIVDAPQRSPEWFAARLGRATGSCADKVIAAGKGGEAFTRRDYRIQLAAERLTGKPQEDVFQNDAMLWGIAHEGLARLAYEAKTGNIVRETGFLKCHELMVGASLDGDVDNFDGVIEIKCPKTSTHLQTIDSGVLPSKYRAQVTHALLVSSARWCDFVSFDPRLPEHLQLFIVRVERADLDVDGYRKELEKFLLDVDVTVAKLEAFGRTH